MRDLFLGEEKGFGEGKGRLESGVGSGESGAGILGLLLVGDWGVDSLLRVFKPGEKANLARFNRP